ncbi:MAG: hypothetical protein KGQ41_02495 [Alphaproteobacteria bacterium]|nr:hypothetical protein [Alphaproteobacteria bacterium]
MAFNDTSIKTEELLLEVMQHTAEGRHDKAREMMIERAGQTRTDLDSQLQLAAVFQSHADIFASKARKMNRRTHGILLTLRNQALECFTTAAALDASLDGPVSRAAELALEMGLSAKAFEYARTAIARNVGNKTAWRVMASLYESTDEHAKAAICKNNVASIEVGNLAAVRVLAAQPSKGISLDFNA